MFLRTVVGLCAVSLLVTVTTACGGGSKQQGASIKQATAQAAAISSTEAPLGGHLSGAAGELQSVAENFAKVKSFRARMTSDRTGAGPSQVEEEYVAPDRLHVSLSGGGAGLTEAIKIGTDTYTKTGSTWTKAPVAIPNSFDLKSTADNAVQGLERSTVTKGGTDTVDGKRCQLYHVTRAGESTGVDVCVYNGLPLQIVAQTSNGKVTIVYTDYNSNIDINPPI
jgi:hypothetical protein